MKLNSTIRFIRPLGFQWETKDPFLFCVHHEDNYPNGNIKMEPIDSDSLKGRTIGQDFKLKDGWRMYHGSKIPGFPAHPHRGFETITYVRKGLVDHADSMGATGRFGNGDVQWMTAGKGVQHSEMFPLLNQEGGNPFELFQIWLNLPKASKFAEPHYAMLWHEEIPIIKLKDVNGKSIEIALIAGAYQNTNAPSPAPNSWAVNPNNNVAVWIIKMETGAQWSLPSASTGLNRSLYFYEGDLIEVEGQPIESNHAVDLISEHEVHIKNGQREANLLLLQGKPINESVAQYGPFVMNTQSEIQEAMQEFQRTQFGGWPWSSHEHVNPREKGRFAQYSDGTVDIKT